MAEGKVFSSNGPCRSLLHADGHCKINIHVFLHGEVSCGPLQVLQIAGWLLLHLRHHEAGAKSSRRSLMEKREKGVYDCSCFWLLHFALAVKKNKTIVHGDWRR